jgi:ABC-2 type transport system ATP-binding protein
MADGRLVALDTPAGLKRTWVPERVLVARGRDLAGAAGALAAVPGVRGVSPFGAGLHVRVEAGAGAEGAVAAALGEAGAREVEVEVAEPSLEDVFLAVVGGGAKGEGGP